MLIEELQFKLHELYVNGEVTEEDFQTINKWLEFVKIEMKNKEKSR